MGCCEAYTSPADPGSQNAYMSMKYKKHNTYHHKVTFVFVVRQDLWIFSMLKPCWHQTNIPAASCFSMMSSRVCAIMSKDNGKLKVRYVSWNVSLVENS